MIELTIYGIATAQGRPRFFRRGNFVGTYDPDKSHNWKDYVRSCVLNELKHRPLLETALLMRIAFFLPRPKTLPKKVMWHTKKPDLDNLAKAVKDALKGICYRDDSQIISLLTTKAYAGDRPMVVITIDEAKL